LQESSTKPVFNFCAKNQIKKINKIKKWDKIVKRETQKSPNLKSSSRDVNTIIGARILYIQFIKSTECHLHILSGKGQINNFHDAAWVP
jgi:hypothetical protein